MCPWDMDAPALTYRQTGSRWLTDLKSTYTVQLIMLKLYAKYQIILPSRSCEIFDENVLDERTDVQTDIGKNLMPPTAFYLSFRSTKFS